MSYGADALLAQPLVIDNGSGLLKAGYAGENLPKCAFPSLVGTVKYEKSMVGGLDGDVHVGRAAVESRGVLRLRYALDHGVVNDWTDMERVWSHMYTSELKCKAEEHPVLLTEPALNPRAHRDRAAEVFFETFHAPAMFVSIQAVLSLYASGRTTGLVLDCGDGVSHVVPVVQGISLPHCIRRSNIGGRDVTDRMMKLLQRSGYALHTSSERDVCREIKEKVCEVAVNKAEAVGSTIAEYTMPDGTTVSLGDERWQAPEILFDPSLGGTEYEGVQQMLFSSVSRADVDVRRTLYGGVTLAGGSTLFRGFGQRLLSELHELVPKDVTVRIAAPPERKYSAWIGGSILAALSTFRRMWVTAAEYQEAGAAALHTKGF